MYPRNLAILMVLSSCLMMTACNDDDDEAVAALVDIVTTAQTSSDYSTLADAIAAADLTTALQAPGPFTVLAPSNDAFAALGPTLTTLLQPANQATLQNILQYHVLNGRVASTDITGSIFTTALNGDPILVDNVLGTIYINQYPVEQADIPASNGIIHGIGTVLTTPDTIAATLTRLGNFTVLLDALTEANLVSPFDEDSDPQTTVFAPTDTAFATAGLSTATDFSGLGDVLAYHVLGSAVPASSAVAVAQSGGQVATIDSATTPITLSLGTGLQVNATIPPSVPNTNAATVTTFNIICTNGVIHIIDRVLSQPPVAPKTSN